ncbi:Beta-barrel assembly-enhancing protease [Curvibacter sp. AEP1-3]|uniref:M48 family metalloprotease n=1 Tax=Curvibacter sp. AEP1-3 TaxID=1844971 RepID=UPI000B3D4F6A|nr:M48 family metalloprotease [Curvibacter sp. AEP1-3]ARV19705.1 Beta-barrel assembly-enhancing protease [Curvibacter sp. AEP1-3]
MFRHYWLFWVAVSLIPNVIAGETDISKGLFAGYSIDIPVTAERRLGDRIVRDLYRDPDYIDDPVISDYLQAIWQPLMASARSRSEITPELDASFAWQLLQGRDRTVNAFALPGGYFGVHLGLIGIVSSRDELASVLAHELSHVTQRHIARLMSKQSEQTPWLVGAMILGALAASKNPGGANAVIVGGQAAAAQSQLNFSRDMEREADRTGFGVASDAGFSPQGFVSMFEKLQQSNRNNDSGNFPYLRSHPLTTERIADMKSRIPEGASTAPTGTLEHAMVSARARLLSNSSVEALRNWYSETEPGLLAKSTSSQKVASLYGATLAAIKLRDFSRALEYSNSLQTLVATDAPAKRQSRYLRAELFMAEGKPDAALSTLGFNAAPKTRADLLLWIPLKVATGQADVAADAAQLWLIDNPTDASMWQQLASARASQGRMVAAVRAEAEVNIAYFDYAAAVSRLKAAQSLYRSSSQNADHIEASIVDVRLRQVEQLLREQAVER